MKPVYMIGITVFFISYLCFCRKTVSPPVKLDDACNLQYTVSKWLEIGDSLVFPACPDSLTFTLSQRNTDATYNTELKVVDLGPNEDSTFWIDEHWYYSVLLFKLKIEKFTDTSILLRVWYNYY